MSPAAVRRSEALLPSGYADAARTIWRPIDPAGGPGELVRAATLAANSHNTQPWRFAVGDGRISIRPDLGRRCSAVDPDDHHLFASLGCAAENLVQAAASFGLHANAAFDARGSGSIIIDLDRTLPRRNELAAAITERQCTRADYDSQPVSAAERRALQTAGSLAGVECLIVTERPRMEAILGYVVQGNTAQMRDAAFMSELVSWLRFNDAMALAHRDGLAARTTGNPALPAWLARRLLPFVLSAKRENAKIARHIRSSAGIAVFAAPRNDREGWVAAGRAYQRFALQAAALDIRHAFLNQPVEVPSLRPQIAAYLGLGDRRPDLVVRFGRGRRLPQSLRRPVSDVMDAA